MRTRKCVGKEVVYVCVGGWVSSLSLCVKACVLRPDEVGVSVCECVCVCMNVCVCV